MQLPFGNTCHVSLSRPHDKSNLNSSLMSINSINETLNKGQQILLDEFNHDIQIISALLEDTSRADLNCLILIIEKHPITTIANADFTYYIRLLRGVVMLIRNSAPHYSVDQAQEMVSSLLLSLLSFLNSEFSNHELAEKTIDVYLQALANLSGYIPETELVLCINDVVKHMSRSSDALNIFLAKIFEGGKSIDIDHNNAIYTILKIPPALNYVLKFVLDQYEQVEFEIELPIPEQKLVKFCSQVISHESFWLWLNGFKSGDPDVATINISDNLHPDFTRWLRLAQTLIPLNDWSEYELIPLLAWVMPCFQDFQETTILAINNKNDDKRLQLHMAIILDIVSELCQYNQGKLFLIHYNIIEPLVNLLRVVHQNVKPITLKDRQGLKIEDLQHFPHVKSIIIEIFSYLTIDQFEIQEKIRELHALEIILSNCVIDENNPYIKERSILCLRYVLASNTSNQKFVAKLEAVKPTDDAVLKEVGYEVEVVEGKVVVKGSGG